MFDEYYDLHRHLGACISGDFIYDVLKLTDPIITREYVNSKITFTNGETRNFKNFLSKFTILESICWNLALLRKSIQHICDGLKRERIKYCWLDFSVNKYYRYISLTKAQLIEKIYEYFEEFAPGQVGLVLSFKYETLAIDYDNEYFDILNSTLMDKMVGIDLVGDERKLNKELCIKTLRPWKDRGKMVRMHVAESCGVENADFAINDVGVTNIAHGIKILEKPKLIDQALDKQIVFDVAITSNYITGVLPDNIDHPISKMLELGLLVTINSDDPVQLDCTIESEFKKAMELGLTKEQLINCQELSKANIAKYSI